MKVMIFSCHPSGSTGLEKAINEWLKANPKVEIIDRQTAAAMSYYPPGLAMEAIIVITIWYEEGK